MRRIWILAAALGGLCSANVFAQPNPIGSLQRPQTTNPSPAVSPYLGMFGGGNAAINYFSIVRPNIEGAQEFSQLQQGLYNLQFGGAGASASNGDPNFANQTGHPVAFWNYSHYYPLMNRYGGGGVGSGIGARGVAQPTFNRGGFAAFNSPQNTQPFQTAPFFVAPSNPNPATK
jgi:hypothetical protein